MSRPRVAVSLVTYNGARWVEACLASVWAQEGVDVDLFAIDNGSSDGTPELLRSLTEDRPAARLELSSTNLGFAAAHNRSIVAAEAEYVCLLNQDVVLDPAYLRRATSAFQGPRVGAVQGKVYRLNRDLPRSHAIDSAGLEIARNRRVTSRGQGHAGPSAFEDAEEVFGVDGACPVYRRAALLDARVPRDGRWEILDEDFWMYKEDVDLAWRLVLFGWEARYEPRAVAWHARSAGGSEARSAIAVMAHRRRIPSWIKRLSWRNQGFMQLKNETGPEVLRDLPAIAVHQVAAFAYLVVSDPRNLSAIADLIAGLRPMRRKRAYIQHRRAPGTGISRWVSQPADQS